MDKPIDSEQCNWIQNMDGIPGSSCGDSAALKIWKFEWLVANISQSSCVPCEKNFITVSFKTNVVMSTVCNTNITISGLTNAIASDGDMRISSSFFKSSCGNESYGTWDNTRKELVLILNKDVEANSAVSFTFEVTNPATAQNCPEIIIYTHGLHNEAHQSVMSYDEASQCAMMVCRPAFTAVNAVQKSNLPCDDNRICLMFSLNASINQLCSAELTIYGIVTSPQAPFTFYSRDPEHVFPQTYVFVPANFPGSPTGSIRFNTSGSLTADVNYTLCFSVVNQACKNLDPLLLSIQANFQDSTPVAQAGKKYIHCKNRSAALLPLVSLFRNASLKKSSDESTDISVFMLQQNMLLFNSTSSADLADARPFHVRPNFLVIDSMVQSSSIPCSPNIITTTISSPRDIVRREGTDTTCQPVVLFNIPLCNVSDAGVAITEININRPANLFANMANFTNKLSGTNGSGFWLRMPLRVGIVANTSYTVELSKVWVLHRSKLSGS